MFKGFIILVTFLHQAPIHTYVVKKYKHYFIFYGVFLCILPITVLLWSMLFETLTY